MHEGGKGRRLVLVPVAVMIERNLSVPRGAVEGEFEIALPHFVTDARARLGRRQMIGEAVIGRGEFEPAALKQRAWGVPPAMQPPILRPTSIGAPRLVDLGQGGDDVQRPAQIGERELDAGAGGLLGLEEDEFVGVADNHGCATGAKRGLITSPSAPRATARDLPVWRRSESRTHGEPWVWPSASCGTPGPGGRR